LIAHHAVFLEVQEGVEGDPIRRRGVFGASCCPPCQVCQTGWGPIDPCSQQHISPKSQYCVEQSVIAVRIIAYLAETQGEWEVGWTGSQASVPNSTSAQSHNSVLSRVTHAEPRSYVHQKERQEDFALFSDHSGSLLRQQPGAVYVSPSKITRWVWLGGQSSG